MNKKGRSGSYDQVCLLLKKAREEKHLTQTQLGGSWQKREYISRVENNESNLTLKTLFDIVEKGLAVRSGFPLTCNLHKPTKSRKQTMRKHFYIAAFILLVSCGQAKNNSDKNAVARFDTSATASKGNHTLTDETLKFLWRENKYDEELKDTVSTIVINDELCKTLTEPERAALGLVVTFIGSECDWDGEAKDDFSNLKCKALTALDLGYQCSDRHLSFLRRWFKNDNDVPEELKDCPVVPYTASSQNTFDDINLKVKGNIISVEFSANGVYIWGAFTETGPTFF